MIRIVNPKLALCGLVLALALSGCNIDTHAQPEAVPAPVQPQASIITWSEPGALAVYDGNIELYH